MSCSPKRRLLQLDSINSISIDKSNRLYNLLDENVIKEREEGQLKFLNGIVEYEQTLRPQPMTKQKVKCNCRKSKCLKLYCDCFNQGQVCSSDCNCHNCSNTDEHKQEREIAIKYLQERNPDAFKPKLQTKEDDEVILVHNKGCNCKKSGCEKKYCECYNTGVKCSDQCKCEGCRNRDSQQLVKINNPSLGNTSFSNNLSSNHKQQVEQYLNEDMFQNSQNSNQNRFRQSQDEFFNSYSQPAKKFNLSEFNENIPRRLSLGIDSQNIYSKFSHQFNFQPSLEEKKNVVSIHNSNNQKFYSSFGGTGGFSSSQIKRESFEENSQKSPELKEQENTTINLSLHNGQIKNIITKKE